MKKSLVCALLALALGLGAEAEELKGRVVLSGQLEEARKASRNRQESELMKAGYDRQELPDDRSGSPPFKKEEEAANVVVWLEGSTLPAGGAKEVSMNQSDRRFVPHVLPVVSGSTVVFPNGDRIFHHVFSIDPSFDFPKYPPTAAAPSKMPRRKFSPRQGQSPTVVELFCGIHSRMNAYIVVLPNRFFATADKQGNFRLTGMPAGSYKLRAWHPRATPRLIERSVTVPSDEPLVLTWK